MKHVSEIEFEGDDKIYGDRVGYCKDIDGYIFRTMSGWVYDYCMYYSISKEEFQLAMQNLDELNNGRFYHKILMPKCYNRYIGAGYTRGYDIFPFKINCGDEPFIYRDTPYLVEDGVFFFHCYWQGHHYAAAPRAWESRINVNGKMVYTGPFRERSDISLQKINYNGNDIPLCYGKEIFEFDGMDEWEQLLKESRITNS